MRCSRGSSALGVGLLAATWLVAGCAKYVKDETPYKVIKTTRFEVDPNARIEVVDRGLLVSVRCNRETLELYCEKRNQLTGSCDEEASNAKSAPSECRRELPASSLSIEWASESIGVKQNNTSVLFPIEWSEIRVNPLAADAAAELATEGVVRIGVIESKLSIDADAARRVVEMVARGSTLDMSVAAEERPVALSVESLAVASGDLKAGEANALVVTVRNNGPGVAYRVNTTISSSLPGLHKRGAAVGKLEPDTSRTVKIPVQVDSGVTERTAMVVVKLSEHNHPAQPSHNQRLKVVISESEPVKAGLTCQIAGNDSEALVVAGKQALVKCSVVNKSDKQLLSDFEVKATLGSSSRAVAVTRAIEPGKSRAVVVGLAVPGALEGDAQVAVALGGRGVVPTSVTLEIKVASGLCGGKKLTMAEYRERRAKLEKAFQAGALTATEFDRYDAELVSCLK